MRTSHGIPIRNLWHMLHYAWGELPAASPLTFQEVESAPTLDALFALLLVRSMQQRMRVGLGHAYGHQEKRLRNVRGRINFSESLRQHLFEKGETACEFGQYSLNEPRNQIIKSTLVKLIQAGEFGPGPKEADALRHRLRWLVRSLDGIDLVEISPALIGRQLLAQNDQDYRLMLSVCELVLLKQMPIDSQGTHPLPSPCLPD